MKVSEIMTPAPVALPLEAPLSEAARLMRDLGVGDVLVTTDGRLCGLITDRDIVIRAVAEERDGARTSLGDVCSADLVTVSPDDDTAHAADLMRRRSVRRLPVVSAGLPIGIVSVGDLTFDPALDGIDEELDPHLAFGPVLDGLDEVLGPWRKAE